MTASLKAVFLLTAAMAVPHMSSPENAGPATAPSTQAVEARLRAIYAATDWKADPTKCAKRAAYFKLLLGSGKLTTEQQRVVYPQLAHELLSAGDPNASLAALTAYAALPGFTPAEQQSLHESRALAWLRLGEQENCLQMHGQHSCVFPLRATAVHGTPRGAEGAVGELTWLLQHNHDDALSRWLLNIAYMQLGRWPHGVPAQWLLSASLFASEGQTGEFLDYAGMAGVDVISHAGGAIVEDLDGDGFLDVVTSSSGPLDAMHLFHNNGDGTFSDWTTRAGLTGELGGLNLVLTDYDNDGHPDILVLRGGWWGKYGAYPLSLLHNRGDGTFEDVTERAGLTHLDTHSDAHSATSLGVGPTQTAAWADYDNDGRLDLFVGYESAADDPHPSLLFHNNGDGTFTEVGHALGLDRQGFVKGVAWGDYNNDGRPDLFLSTHDGHNRLLRNDGPADPAHPDPAHWRFTDVTAQAGLAKQGPSFATWFFDYNNDGWPDLFVAGYSAASMQDVGRFEAGQPFDAGVPHLYRNNRDGTFTDVAHPLHLDRAILTMGANFGDLDNDGWLDVYLGTGEPSYQALLPNRMFRNDGGQRFQDVTTDGGFGHLQKGHAIAFADIENRGQEDIFEEMGGAFPGDPYQSALYRNPGHAGHSITLRLEGTRSNRAGYGARLEAVFREDGRERHVFRLPGSVSSFGGNPMEQHIGLGKATSIDTLRIHWPAGAAADQVFHNVAVDRQYHVREGASSLAEEPRRSFTLGQATLHADAMH